MLGSEVIITGISPEAAQTLVQIGVQSSALNSGGKLARGVAEAFALIGYKVQASSE